MVDVRRLRVLRELADQHTITATAAALHLTPSAVSQQIATLSREAGVPLLSRSGRGVQLTSQARLLLDHAAVIHAQLERARADLAAYADGRTGHVSIGAFATAISGLAAPAVARLRRLRPELSVRVVQTQAPDCFTRLDTGDLDIIITVDWRNAPHHTDPRYTRRNLLTDPLLLAVPADHALASQPTLNLAQLADQPWIAGAPGGPCVEVSLAACAAHGFNPDVRHLTDDWNATLGLVAAGAGVALVPNLAVRPTPGVVLRQFGPNGPARRIFAALRAGSEQSPLLIPVLAALSKTSEQANCPPSS